MAVAPGIASRFFLAVMSALRTPAPTPAAVPLLVPIGQHQGRTALPLSRLLTLIGSAPSARLYLPSKAVSRCHAVIINAGPRLMVRDLASRTQTRLNGQPVTEADLGEGDVLQAGPFTFRFTHPGVPTARPPLPGPMAVLQVNGLDQPLPLNGRTTLIGRREKADISLVENAASSAHVLIFVAEGKHLVRDLNSRTGTFVNGIKVHEHALSPGDLLRVGETDFRYLITTAPADQAIVPAAPTTKGAIAEDLIDSQVGPAFPPEPTDTEASSQGQ